MGLYGKNRIIGKRDNSRMCAREASAHRIWKMMMYKAFSREEPKESRRNHAVTGAWKAFSNFYDWYCVQHCSDLTNVYINKDLLFPDNKVYGPEACVLLPKELHDLLSECRITRSDLEAMKAEYVGKGREDAEIAVCIAYEAAKAQMEEDIRSCAIKHKDILDERAYRALMFYEIKITN